MSSAIIPGMDATQSGKLIPVPRAEACGTAPAPPALAPHRAHALADQLKALADPTRLRLLDLLAQQTGPLCVCALTALFPQHQPTISHHLRVLRQAGLVDCEKRGVWAYYWATVTGQRALSVLDALP